MNAFGTTGTMTSKQRVLTAVARQEPDRVPIDYSANPAIDGRLKEHFGLAPADYAGLMEALGVDFRGFDAPYVGPRLHEEKPDRMVDPMFGITTRWIEHGSGGYWDFCDFPLQNADEEMAANWPMPSPDDFDYSGVKAWCEANKEYCCFVGNAGLGDFINSSGMVRTMQQVLIDLAMDDPVWKTFVDRKHAIQLEVLSRTLEAAEGGIDLVWIGEDLGTQDGQMVSLDLFRMQLRPRHQKTIDVAKTYGLPVMIHSCGSSSWAFDDFIEMGIDVVDTLQPEAANMAPAYLKERFGDKLAFHGCISTAGPVSFGTVDDVVKDCREKLDTLMPGGGYCYAPTHALQDNSPTENVLAMYETVHKHGFYK